MDLQKLLTHAELAARAGGEVVLAGRSRSPAETKGAGDYVTDVDRASERAIAVALHSTDIPMVGEEEGGRESDRYWLVDPLDGTTNFMHSFPVVGISVALIEHGSPVAAVVHAPFLGETYTAIKDRGANLRSRDGDLVSLSVSGRPPERAIVATGFPFRDKALIPRHLAALKLCLERFEDLRRPGAASLDLAWVAAGVFDGFFELGLSSWDVAAGALLVEEAGGVVSDWQGGGDYLGGNILAGSPAVHQELLALTQD